MSATNDIRVLCSSDNGHFLFQRYIDGHCQKCQPKKSQEGPCDSMAGTGRKAVSTEIAEHFTILYRRGRRVGRSQKLGYPPLNRIWFSAAP